MRMKKYIIPIVMALLCFAPKASAQGSYYYYHGNQIALEVDPATIVTIAQKNTAASHRTSADRHHRGQQEPDSGLPKDGNFHHRSHTDAFQAVINTPRN